MDDVPEARAIFGATLAEMVRLAESDVAAGSSEATRPDASAGSPGAATTDWELREAEPAERGFCSVYRVVVEDGATTRELYVKASPDGQDWAIPTEARIQAVLDAHTSIPVPEVLGIVDDHDRLPTPYYVMTARPGESLPYERVARLADDALRRLARETGAHLAELHGVPAVEEFGHVRRDAPDLTGGRPAGDPANLAVGIPVRTGRRTCARTPSGNSTATPIRGSRT